MTRPNTLRWVALIIALMAALASLGVSYGQNEGYSGRPIDDGCVVNVALNTGREWPTEVISVIAQNGGVTTITPVGPAEDVDLTIQLTITKWAPYEDSAWGNNGEQGDLRDYEVECGARPAPRHETYVPIVNN